MMLITKRYYIWLYYGSEGIGEGNDTPVQYSCLENPVVGGVWWAAVHGVAKSRTRLSDFTFPFHFHALEKEMATGSSVLAWRVPGMGSHRVRHNWSDLAAAAVAAAEGIESAWNAGDSRDVGSIPGSGRSSGKENGNPLQYSCLENSMNRGVWWATFQRVTKSQTWLMD